MDVLKKIKASTLMETMVATVLIVVIFMLSSLILNNLFMAKTKGNRTSLDNYFHKLEYLYVNDKVDIPFYEQWEDWEITIKQSNQNGKIIIEAIKEAESGKKAETSVFYAKSSEK